MAQHRVQPRDTLWSIAQRYRVSLEELRATNRLASDHIEPGDVLELPKPKSTRRVTQSGKPSLTLAPPSSNGVMARIPRSASSRLGSLLAQCQPKGAGAATAKAEQISLQGAAASHALAAMDLIDIQDLKHRFVQAGKAVGLPPALLAAIASRESHVGQSLRGDGWSQSGQDFGIMQVNRIHNPEGTDDPTSLAHIMQAARILADMRDRVRKRHGHWSEAQILQAAVAAYNFGPRNVRSFSRLDEGTSNNDYSNDIVARAQYFERMVPGL